MWHALQSREIGSTPPRTVARYLSERRTKDIDIARDKEIVSGHRTAVNCLQVDRTEGRYLLSGTSNGSLAVYDTQQASKNDVDSGLSQHEAFSKAGSHQYSVSSVAWYPIDTGLFISGAFDKRVLVHDTNTMQVEVAFELPGKVHSVAMSGLGLQHTLVAVGTDSPLVRLCDISSGAFTHSLTGHRDAVWAVQWSATSEWVVITGGCDGAIRLWDVRRAGCFSILDHNKSWQAEKQHKASTGRRISGRPGVTPQRGRQNFGGLAKAGAVRTHPGMASEASRATAHNGPITALQTTPDGTYLVSTGGDNRMRLWDIDRGCNTLINYPGTRISAVKGTGITISSDGKRVYLPSGNNIQVYDTWTGQLQGALIGHFDKVNCCVFHPWDQEVYSGSNDRQILVWAPPPTPGDLEGSAKGPVEKVGTLPDVDAWSDDERHVVPLRYRLQF